MHDCNECEIKIEILGKRCELSGERESIAGVISWINNWYLSFVEDDELADVEVNVNKVLE